jgi:hypothetical protein
MPRGMAYADESFDDGCGLGGVPAKLRRKGVQMSAEQ